MSYPSGIVQSHGAASITTVEAGSPAARAGLEPGMVVLSAGGEPLRDILDWYWLADDLEVSIEIAQKPYKNGERKTTDPEYVVLSREPGENWGIEFSQVLFDEIRCCVNNCSFCFMKMLPEGLRSSLHVRDDDYRLSFLHGNFVTLTNLSDGDIAHIIERHLSPLHVSLHAVDAEVRAHMMGRNHARGIDALEQLLSAGIECKVQIVLMPHVNDGKVLAKTLDWIFEHPGISATGIVPYGYTRYAKIQQGFDTPKSARLVIEQLQSLAPQVQLADEFYCKAWPGEIVDHLPKAGYYGSFPLLEDGIGMVRQFCDTYANLPNESSWINDVLCEEGALLVTGEAFGAVLKELFSSHSAQIFIIKNNYFGGNVDVAGLLTAEDIIAQVAHTKAKQLIVPPVMFNDDGLTLDNKTVCDIADTLGINVKVLDFK